MNRDIVEGNWKQLKGKVMAQWGELTGDRLDVIAGKRIERSGRAQESCGMTKDESDRQLREFRVRNRNFNPK